MKKFLRIFFVVLLVISVIAGGIAFLGAKQIPTQSKYVTGSLSMPLHATPYFYNENNKEVDFTKLVVGETYTFDIDVENAYKCEFILFNNHNIEVPYTFTAPESCEIQFLPVEDDGLSIQPSPPTLTGYYAIEFASINGLCDVTLLFNDCACGCYNIDTCVNFACFDTTSMALTETLHWRPDCDFCKQTPTSHITFEVTPHAGYELDYYVITWCTTVGNNYTEETVSVLPALYGYGAEKLIYSIDIYLKAVA
jgi:hypothetical protein